ncbi:MAG: FkbM family methyltransferase [Bacteroidia bacterium]|nr:FkbM family methyltransferase [Bacteroidia bacterium]
MVIPEIVDHHSPKSQLHVLLKRIARKEVEGLFNSSEIKPVQFQPFGTLIFPYFIMGAIDSLNLFDLDELIIFCFYFINRGKYKKVMDIGANIGLHTVILSKCGYEVFAFEPDPQHYQILKRNIDLNEGKATHANNAAISNKSGQMEFIRVLGNTTGSHLAGAKKNPYGDLEKFQVDVADINQYINEMDLIKLDAEGHEKEIILSTKIEAWLNTDAFVEVENAENAEAIYSYFEDSPVNLFSQKRNWSKVECLDDMPTSYHDGSLFISSKKQMPWSTH